MRQSDVGSTPFHGRLGTPRHGSALPLQCEATARCLTRPHPFLTPSFRKTGALLARSPNCLPSLPRLARSRRSARLHAPHPEPLPTKGREFGSPRPTSGLARRCRLGLRSRPHHQRLHEMATMTMPLEKVAIEIAAAIDHRAAILLDGPEIRAHVARARSRSVATDGA